MQFSRRALLGATGASVAIVATGCGTSTSGSGSGSGAMLKIGICQYVTHPALDAVHKGCVEEMAKQGYTDGKEVKIDFQNAAADQSTLNNIAQTFASDKKDLVVAIATPVALAMAQAITDKPVVFSAVTDPVSAKLVKSLNAPGGNVTGTSDMNPIDKQVGLIKELLPNAKTIGIVYSSGEANSLVQVNMAKTAGEKVGLSFVTATITNSSEIQQAAQSLVGKVDAFFLPTDNTVVSGLAALVGVSQSGKKPIIACDSDSVKAGCAASYAVDYAKMGTQTGDMVVKILKGAKPADTPVEFQTDPQLTINPAAATKAGLTIPDAVLKAANVTIK